MNERRVSEVLDGLDRARRPRAEFEAALRDELFGPRSQRATEGSPGETNIVELAELDDSPIAHARRSSRRRSVLIAAAAAVLVAVVAVAVPKLQEDKSVVVQGPVSKPTVEAACRRFAETAFSEVSSSELLGPFDQRVLPDRATAHARVDALRRALQRLQNDFVAANVRGRAVANALSIAESHAAAALGFVDDGALFRSAGSLKEVKPWLVGAERELTKLGIASCL